MKRYRYRLETVLDYTSALERALQNEMTRLVSTHQQENHALAVVQAQCVALEDALRKPGPTLLILRSLESTRRLQVQHRLRVAEAERALEAKRAELTEALRERKKLERHRDRLSLAHEAKERAAEVREADEGATVRWVHARQRGRRP